MLHKDAKVELIRKVPIFSECKKKDLEAVARLADLVDVPAGQVLVKEGAPRAREFMIIVDGTAEVTRGGQKVDTIGPGDFFGEIALISGGPRTASVTATSPARLLVVTEQQFRALMERMQSLQISVLKALAARLHNDSV